jgi:hypothetical protein
VVWFGEMPLELDAIDAALGRCALFAAIGTLYLLVAKLATRGELGGGREPVCAWGERARD